LLSLISALVAAPGQAVPLPQEQLRPARAPDAQRLARLIADLDSEEFSVREKAARELEQLEALAGLALRAHNRCQFSFPPASGRKTEKTPN
jgi:hypothetical protein